MPSGTDERGSIDVRMCIKDLFAWHGEHRRAINDNAVALASAEPKASFAIAPTDIAHAVPDELTVSDLRKRGIAFVGEVSLGHHRAANCDFADLAVFELEVVGKGWDRVIADANHFYLDVGDWEADADTGSLFSLSPGLRDDVASRQTGNWKRLGGAVGRKHIAVVWQHRVPTG